MPNTATAETPKVRVSEDTLEYIKSKQKGGETLGDTIGRLVKPKRKTRAATSRR